MNAPDLAYECNGQRVPRERFYAIACDPRRSVAVEACAGAGKTWMLVSRILRALLDGSAPHEILAITFTKKAAGEMRQRLQDWLADYAHASPEVLQLALVQRGLDPAAAQALQAPLRGLYAALLAQGRPVQIRTFHSWFAALLRTAPLAVLEPLGLPANYELLEDDSEAVAGVWRRFQGAVAADPGARSDFQAAVAAYGRSSLFKALEAALAKRVEFALADQHGVVEASIQPMAQVFPEFAGVQDPCELAGLPAVRGAFLAAASRLGRASAPTFSAKGSELEQAVTAGRLEAALEALLTQKGEPRKFNDKLAGIEAVREAQALAVRILAACCQHAAWLHHQRMTRLTRVLLAEFAAHKRERGWVDMNDVERAALVLLSDSVLSGWVQERLDLRVRHLLIDEFQDTNPLQWQALHAWLSSYAGSGGGASAPRVFIVGDPKQSIYRFRRAEPQVFRAAQDFIVEGLGGDRLSCDHTHRNAPALMAAVNTVMAQAQDAGEYQDFRAHTTESTAAGTVLALPRIERVRPAAVAGEGDPDAGLSWRDSLVVPRELPEEKLASLEARQAARWIAGQITAGVRAEDIMVLSRRRERLSRLENELRALHIPAQQPEKTDLCDAPEVQDLTALLDVLVSPGHDLSLARVLKSPIFGVDDSALVQLALLARQAQRDGQPRSWIELLPLARDAAPALGEVAGTLARWKERVDRLPPHDALDAIYHEADVLARYAQCAPAALRASVLANLRALLGAALDVGGARYATPYALVRALRAGGIRGPALAAPGAVKLLTVHGAKGLEAPVVLLLDTDAAPPKAETMGVIVEWPGEAPAPWRFAFLASESRPPLCSAEALAVEQAARRREELNALYVAMTRARQQLVLSCVEPHIAAERSWWQRLLPLATPMEVTWVEQDTRQAAVQAFQLPVVPVPREAAVAATVPAVAEAAADTPAAVFGRAVHRLLERWTPLGAPRWPGAWSAAVGREFKLDASVMGDVEAMAHRILGGEGAWAWDAAAIDWQGNEVELVHLGESLRLDRLVRRRSDGHWWVLDYKAVARPQADEALRAQLSRYRDAVAALHPGSRVQAAFLTGQGRLVQLP